ncbi:unnamed protein product [Lota lota]
MKEKPCEESPQDVYRQVKGNYTKVNGDHKNTRGQEEFYECAPEYRSKYKLFWKCLDGEWTTCVRVCDKPVSTNSNAYLDNKETRFTAGTKVSYTCAIGYAHSGGSRFRTCKPKTLTWSPLKIKCERRSCGSAGEIMNGEVIYTGVEFGHTATAVCAEGHLLVGRATRTCLSGGWDGRPAVCEAVQCTEPKTNAERTGSWRALYAYRQVLTYSCRKGTLVGQRAIWCTENGTWSAPPPVCKEVECPFPNVPHSSRSGSRFPPFNYRSTLTFTCNPGYMLVGRATVSCSLGGTWTPGLPDCRWNWPGK